MYKEDLELNNLQGLICHKNQPNQINPMLDIQKLDDNKGVYNLFLVYRDHITNEEVRKKE